MFLLFWENWIDPLHKQYKYFLYLLQFIVLIFNQAVYNMDKIICLY
ncbi:Hypothetical protein GbCGDNIH9_8429 [Granulibacter bethesdensis]|uniref:Uncharacterized protein n=1 Tax=Granulibacter bethesdensis TaxID=364410 RepID=A0AAC9P863_9PROT|nr:Hypothetical protein GbCGDNIH9_8429 [Granulibacter bethesdensis]APH61448.1 Hypothetical protein GbCGDNIH8_8429 [Granulibacter bethesdensis]